MAETLNLYASGSDLNGATGTVGLLCEFAPDSPSLRNIGQCYRLDDLLGSADAALAEVYPLVGKLLRSAPVLDGLPFLYLFEEPLLEQLSYIKQAFHLDSWISERGFRGCRFVSYSPWLDRLLQVRKVTSSAYTLVSDVPLLQTNSSARAFRKLWNSRPKPPEAFRRIMPLWSRHLSGTRLSKAARGAPRGGIWFYSTAYNFTRIGLQYEPYLPQKVNYLVEEPGTGGKALREMGRPWHWLYAWSERSDIPNAHQVRAIADRLTGALLNIECNPEESRLRAVLLQSEWWQHFLTRRLPFAIYNNRVLRRWRAAIEPEMVLVGNAGWERALLLNQSSSRIPTVLLQHGIMHWTYAVTNEPVDLFLLRGPFFQKLVSERMRPKTVIQNFPESSGRPAIQKREKDTILFITIPYDLATFFHLADLHDTLRSLLRVAKETNSRLAIRVHPMEKIATYEEMAAELQKELGLEVDVVFSQGPGVEELFTRSSVAVLYFSTMFMDCLRYQVPIVSFAWHWFPNTRAFQAEGIFNLARSLSHFEELVRSGVAGGLPQRSDGLEEFLAPGHPEELKQLFQGIWSGRHSFGDQQEKGAD